MDRKELQALIDAEEADNTEEETEEELEGVQEEETESDESEEETEETATTTPAFMADDDESEEEEETGTKEQGGTIRAIAKQREKKRIAEDKAKLLEEENRRLKEQLAQGSVPQEVGPRPKIDDYGSDEDYDSAVDKWHVEKARAGAPAAQAASDQAQSAERHQRKTAAAYDSHIDRADALVKEHNIDPATYQQAEESFMESVIDSGNVPQNADGKQYAEGYMKELIRVVGNGSEKVLLHLLANKKSKREFDALVATDKNGLEVAAWLGAKAYELQKDNTRKRSNAKKPAPQTKGSPGANSAKGKGLRKQFDAIKGKDLNKALDFRRQAKKSGVDVSDWG